MRALAPHTTPPFRNCRLRLPLFLPRMWPRLAARCVAFLPDPVTLKRLAIPLCVLALGIAVTILGTAMTVRCHAMRGLLGADRPSGRTAGSLDIVTGVVVVGWPDSDNAGKNRNGECRRKGPISSSPPQGNFLPSRCQPPQNRSFCCNADRGTGIWHV